MTPEAHLRAKLDKIEALFAGAGTAGERAAAGAAAERIRARLRRSAGEEHPVEMRFALPDAWSRQLFVALSRRYGLRPYRYRRQRKTTVMLRAPRSFLEGVLWPEFLQINDALTEYLAEVTDRIVREAVHGTTGEADEVEEPATLIRR